MCLGHESNGEFAGESGRLHREWWRTENLRFFSNSQDVENQRKRLGNKKAERCVRPAKRQKMVAHFLKNQEYSLLYNILIINALYISQHADLQFLINLPVSFLS